MRFVLKDRICFAVADEDGTPLEIEIRVRPDRFGGWEATALLRAPGAPAADPLSRVFRSRDRRLTTSKMVAWVRRRYVHARPLASWAVAIRLADNHQKEG